MKDLKGTNIAASIVPFTDNDTFPTHDSLYGKGGYREVATIEERDSLPVPRLREGCKVYVVSEGKEYRYLSGDWEEIKASGDFIPTGTTGDGTPIQTFDDLIGFIIETSGGQGVQRNVRIVNNLGSKNISASKGEPCNLQFTFVSQERYSYNEPFQDTGERGLCEISVRASESADYTVAKKLYISSSAPVSVDVAEYLTSGANNVMIKVTGEVTNETTPAFVYTVQLTSLSIAADNFKWWTAYTGDITLPLNIGGNISKTLHVTLSGEDYNESYEVQLGTAIYIETAYNYAIPHPGRTGIFNLSAYVANSDGSIKTKTVAFNIICAVAGEQKKLVAVNTILPKATNWVENVLVEYSIYDGDNVYTSAQFVVKKDVDTVFSSSEDSIATSSRNSFSIPLEIETMDDTGFDIMMYILDGQEELISPLSFPVNNSLGYSAVSGSVFYMNPKKRSNRQDNSQFVINEVDGSIVASHWEGMNWGNDGWQSDTDGNRMLRLMAGSFLSLGYYPFKKECARTGKTIEIDYRIDNVTDFAKPVLTISSPSGNSFIGLNIYADDIVMHTQSLKNTDLQEIHTYEGKRIRMSLVIMPDAYGNSGLNLCVVYINGIKNREFTYENNDYFAHNGGIVIGSDFADIDIYGIRIYDSALTSQGCLRNYINWMVSTNDKKKVSEANDVLDANGSEMDFENTKDQYNVMVFDNTIPRLADPSAKTGTLEICFVDHPERNVSITNVEAKGQGTSSMRYYLWNTKYAIDKNLSVITYADGATGKKTWQMTPDIPAAAKFTGKKNYASSMQSHKIGSVNSIQDLFVKMGFSNEAMQTAKYPDARIAVYQLPFVCFEKSLNDDGETVYTFAGMYTFGPDKGDKYTFGYDTDLFPNLISIEGSDNSPLATLFRVPWNEKVAYNPDEEAFQYNGANAWDFDGGLETNIDKWIPAYNFVYSCSPRLKPFNGTFDELNAQVSVLRTEPYEFWIAKAGDDNQYNVYYYESSENRFVAFGIGNGTINLVSQLCDRGYGLLTTDLAGKTHDEQNTLFINARITRFRQEASTYWDINDAIFHRNWVEMHAGTDNRAKNTYVYSFGTPTSKFKWRYDDLDTIFDTDNEGLPEKSYGVEIHDVNENGAAVWNGETSNFWNLIDLAFPAEIVSEMKRMLTCMEELSGLKSGTDFDKLFAYYQKYYFNYAQEYFPANIYNADAKIAYEYGKLAYINGSYSNDTDPITQSLGDHYSAEQRWISKRILYMMSKYSFGLFAASGTDSITVRAAGNTIKYELTPAMDLYPAIANGTSIIRGKRTKAGDICEMLIELSGSGDQQNTIQGASYLQDIGDWHEKNVSGTMGIKGRMLREIRLGSKTEKVIISISALTLSNCVSLQTLLLSNISTLRGTLNLSSCTHLKEVYADGTSLVQLILPSGGGLRMIEFSAFNQYLSLSNYPLLTNNGVKIDLCKAFITDFFIVDCPLMQPMKLLVDIMNAQEGQENHALRRVRAVGFEETYDTSDMLDKLAELSNGSYEGLSSEGIAGEDSIPVLDGTLNVYANYYMDSVEALRSVFKKLVLNVVGKEYVRFKDPIIGSAFIAKAGDGVGITMLQVQSINNYTDISFKGNTAITSFDEFMFFTGLNHTQRYFFENCVNLESVKLPISLEFIDTNSFKNTAIRSIKIPQNVKTINGAAFQGCKNLQEVTFNTDKLESIGGSVFRETGVKNIILPDNVTSLGDYLFYQCIHLKTVHYPINKSITEIPQRQFEECSALIEINISEYITALKYCCFRKCISLKKIELSDSINIIQGAVFFQCESLEKFVIPPLLTIISDEMLRRCYSLKNLEIPKAITSIGIYGVSECTGMEYIVMRPAIPPSIVNLTFWNTPCKFYVPDESVTAYKTATNWSQYANRIYPLSTKPE